MSTTRILPRRAARNLDRSESPTLGLSNDEIRRFSLRRCLQALAEHQKSRTPVAQLAPFESEVSAATRRLFHEPGTSDSMAFRGAISVPPEIANTWWRVTPPLNTTDTGALVGTDQRGDLFGASLKAQPIVVQLGAQVLGGLVGNIDIPKATAEATTTWLGEDDVQSDSDLPVAQVSMTPTTVSGMVSFTRRLMKQSSPDVELMLRNELAATIGSAIDAAAIGGSGASNQPTGIVNTSGVGTQGFTTPGQPTFAEIVAMETTALAANSTPSGYAAAVAVGGHLKSTGTSTGADPMWGNGVLNGLPAVASNNVPTGTVVCGDWSELFIGLWGPLDLSADVATKAATGGVVMRAFQDVDIGVRHPAAFVVGS